MGVHCRVFCLLPNGFVCKTGCHVAQAFAEMDVLTLALDPPSPPTNTEVTGMHHFARAQLHS